MLQVLKEKPERGIIIAYITWRCDIGEARKQSTVLQYFKCLQAIFLKHHSNSLSQDVSHQVKNISIDVLTYYTITTYTMANRSDSIFEYH